jgi:serine-protein kinase ATM
VSLCRYNKGDIIPQEFYGKMAKMRQENKNSPDLSSKLTTLFLSLRERFKPVMRHFFTEKHKTPMSWFAMRLNYARSVATTSIVGHILGLGDRHTSNILLDSSTGEVVHIDLGIAFEQVGNFSTPFQPQSHPGRHIRENYYRSQSASRSA